MSLENGEHKLAGNSGRSISSVCLKGIDIYDIRRDNKSLYLNIFDVAEL